MAAYLMLQEAGRWQQRLLRRLHPFASPSIGLLSAVLIWSEILLPALPGLAAGAERSAGRGTRSPGKGPSHALSLKRAPHLATTDPLTGLLNRRAFMVTLAGEPTRSQRLRSCFHRADARHRPFGQINDSHGHPAGDACWSIFAALLTEQLRGIDKLACIGGEEFAIMLVDTLADSAAGVVERLLDAIRHKPADHPGQPPAHRLHRQYRLHRKPAGRRRTDYPRLRRPGALHRQTIGARPPRLGLKQTFTAKAQRFAEKPLCKPCFLPLRLWPLR